MTGKTDNLKLTDEQKTRLLGLGLEPIKPACRPDPDEERGDLLYDILRCPLPPANHPSGIRKGAAAGLGSALGPSLGQLLTDPKIEVPVLRRIKEYAKVRGRRAGSEAEKDAFLAVYFAAIASALTFHNERITGHSDEDLIRFFDFFARSLWMPTDIAGLLADAARHRRNVP